MISFVSTLFLIGLNFRKTLLGEHLVRLSSQHINFIIVFNTSSLLVDECLNFLAEVIKKKARVGSSRFNALPVIIKRGPVWITGKRWYRNGLNFTDYVTLVKVRFKGRVIFHSCYWAESFYVKFLGFSPNDEDLDALAEMYCWPEFQKIPLEELPVYLASSNPLLRKSAKRRMKQLGGF
jgi:hypothetical protein